LTEVGKYTPTREFVAIRNYISVYRTSVNAFARLGIETQRSLWMATSQYLCTAGIYQQLES
jgi:hypothetical protein